MKFTIKGDNLQVDVFLPSAESNNVDELYIHGYTDTSERVVLQQVNFITVIFFICLKGT